jgi:hypothetical protein
VIKVKIMETLLPKMCGRDNQYLELNNNSNIFIAACTTSCFGNVAVTKPVIVLLVQIYKVKLSL